MTKLGVIFGGKSDEHEISILSASSIINAVDRNKYEVVQIGINKKGIWYLIDKDMKDIRSLDDERLATLIPKGSQSENGAELLDLGQFKELVDYAFPILHGPFGEDGTIQGLFEMLDIPYSGCGVTSAALTMDKVFTKEVLIRAGLPVCKHKCVIKSDFEQNKDDILASIQKELGFPLFVKPANMGSSVGISRVTKVEQLEEAIRNGFKYDSRLIIEEEVKGRELETAVLGNDDVKAAAVGEIVAAGQFYDYESKYKDQGTELFIPADIANEAEEEIRSLAIKTFKVLDGRGFSRIDFFMEEKTGNIYINEVNSIPGCTEFSMFPSLWKQAGLAYPQLIERIIELGYEKYNVKNNR